MSEVLTNQDRAAIRRIFEKTKRNTDPLVAARAKETGRSHPKMPDIIAAQNAIRTCIEVVFRECLPYDEFFCGEMAVRLAAYAISAVPIEHQAEAVVLVQKALPGALAEKLRQGAVIKTVWLTDGVEHPNVPGRGDVQ